MHQNQLGSGEMPAAGPDVDPERHPYEEHGEYRYQGGWNRNALIATAVGALFSSVLPNLTHVLPAWWGIYGWFFGVAIGGGLYWVLSLLAPRTTPLAKAHA